jgi:hypothetical protein
LSHQDPPLDELLEPVGKEYGIDWPKLGSPARESTRLVVLNTLDMYSVEWNADHFRELVRGLRAIAA